MTQSNITIAKQYIMHQTAFSKVMTYYCVFAFSIGRQFRQLILTAFVINIIPVPDRQKDIVYKEVPLVG